MPNMTQISAPQLARLIGTPDCPMLIDVCLPEDVALDPRFVPGSVRLAHTDIAGIVAHARDSRVIVICQKGLKLSAGIAAILRSHGIAAEHLTGGQVGWVAAEMPTVSGAALPATSASLWVTRQRPKVDRIACPWLIRRFIDPDARFLFVPASDVAGVAERFEATPFDMHEGPFTHQGEHCTFDAMLSAFNLSMPALDTMATIIRGADTDRLDLSPQSAGLLALSVGLSRQYADDLAQLEAGMALYDALYRWARDGQTEKHTTAGHTP